jgi:predicted lactoylglutathione lyase
MSMKIFVNLPVANLDRSIAFYEAIGAVRNTEFSDETGACMVLSENIYVMLLTHAKFQSFTPRAIPDAHRTSQVLLCISQPNQAAVDHITETAAKAGGTPDTGPKQDYGFMYGRSFADPDGHIWEPMWMHVEAAKIALQKQAA